MVTHCVYDIANMITFLIVTRATCWVGVVKKKKKTHTQNICLLYLVRLCALHQ